MEEINYKKKYEEALEQAKKELATCGSMDCDAARLIFRLFPQLRESENERIRKALIDGVRQIRCKNGITQEQMIAYLEKQKGNQYFVGYVKGYSEGQLNPKQKEPHYTKRNALFENCVENCDPKTVEEVNKRVDDIMNMSELSAFEQALTNFIGYWEDDEERWPSKFVKKHGKHILDMAREELQKEQKPAERSLEDDHIIGFVYDLLNEIEWKDSWAMSKDECLRLLSNYSPQKPAWSEEDEKMLDLIIGDFTDAKEILVSKDAKDFCDREIAWLKSIRPQPRWKPSEEQMNCLCATVDAAIRKHNESVNGYKPARVLKSLYEQLKKLM